MATQYRADHVGSFLRPPELLEARKNAGKDPHRLRSLEDLHIQHVLAKQKELGFEFVTDGELRLTKPLTGHELPFLKANSTVAIKMTLPSATQFPAISFKSGVTDKVYRDHSALLWDIVEIMKSDLAKLSSDGVNYIQIDAPRYSYYMDPKWREWIRKELRTDPDAAFDEAIRADNACFGAARRPGVTLAIQ